MASSALLFTSDDVERHLFEESSSPSFSLKSKEAKKEKSLPSSPKNLFPSENSHSSTDTSTSEVVESTSVIPPTSPHTSSKSTDQTASMKGQSRPHTSSSSSSSSSLKSSILTSPSFPSSLSPHVIVSQCLAAHLESGTSLTSLTVPHWEVLNKNAYYHVQIIGVNLESLSSQLAPQQKTPFIKWIVLRRYSDFHRLHEQMQRCVASLYSKHYNTVKQKQKEYMMKQFFATIEEEEVLKRSPMASLELPSLESYQLPPFPARSIKLLVNHTRKAFLEQRRALFDAYLTALLTHPKWKVAPPLIDFLKPQEEEEEENEDGVEEWHLLDFLGEEDQKSTEDNCDDKEEEDDDEEAEVNELDTDQPEISDDVKSSLMSDSSTSSNSSNNESPILHSTQITSSSIKPTSLSSSSSFSNSGPASSSVLDISSPVDILSVEIPRVHFHDNHGLYHVEILGSENSSARYLASLSSSSSSSANPQCASTHSRVLLKRYDDFYQFHQRLKECLKKGLIPTPLVKGSRPHKVTSDQQHRNRQHTKQLRAIKNQENVSNRIDLDEEDVNSDHESSIDFQGDVNGRYDDNDHEEDHESIWGRENSEADSFISTRSDANSAPSTNKITPGKQRAELDESSSTSSSSSASSGPLFDVPEEIKSVPSTQWKSLLTLLPLLPEKQSRLLTNHSSTLFLEKRRILLQSYLQSLLALPLISHTPLFLQFFRI